MKTVIINPVSPEFVRATFCYTPYLLYAMTKAQDDDTWLFDGIGVADMNSIIPLNADQYWICLWSRTQLEQVKMFVRLLPADAQIKVFGYNPLIEEQGYSYCHKRLTDDEIINGMARYIEYYHEYPQIFTDEPDMHLANLPGKCYPLFTSYGCPWGCNFCPAGINQSKQIKVPIPVLRTNLQYMKDHNYLNIHLIDEDFLLDEPRAHQVVELFKEFGCFNVIALSSRHTLRQYLKKHTAQPLLDAGFKMFEVGLESAAETLGKDMGKGKLAPCIDLAENCPIPILWLNLAFYPGETITTLRTTGDFMLKYGLKRDQLHERIKTNGTWGGLGQFFMTYAGAKYDVDVGAVGTFLTDRPLRFFPSYIPNSFKECLVGAIHPFPTENNCWFEPYKTKAPVPSLAGNTVEEVVKNGVLRGHWHTEEDGYVSMAVASRIGQVVSR